ncbi:hypothetical protein D3C77_468130 [compost metagenome]
MRRRQHFGEAHDLPVFVGNLDTDGGLAGNHFNHTHAGHRQGTGEVFRQVGDTADLDASGRLDFVTGDHRPRMDGVHRDLNAEFLEFDFQQVADTGQGFGRVIDLLFLGRIKDGDRRQGAFDGAVDEQRRLLFLLHALAWLRHLGRRRHDHWRRRLHTLGDRFARDRFTLSNAFLGLDLLAAIRHYRGHYVILMVVNFTQLRYQALTLVARRPPAVGGALEQFKQVEGDLAGHIHDLEPRQVGKHGQTEQEQGNEHQGAALHVQRVLGQVAKAFAQRATGRSWQAGGRMEVNMRQRGARKHQEHQADQAPGE